MGRQRREFTPEYVTRSGVGEAETDPRTLRSRVATVSRRCKSLGPRLAELDRTSPRIVVRDKSAILHIAEFCLGRDTVTIPTGVISDNASWYYVLVQFANERVLICRPNPESASTSRAMVRAGGLDLVAPVVRDALTDRLGVQNFTVESETGSQDSRITHLVESAVALDMPTSDAAISGTSPPPSQAPLALPRVVGPWGALGTHTNEKRRLTLTDVERRLCRSAAVFGNY